MPTVHHLWCRLVLNRSKDVITQHGKLNLHKMITVIISFRTLPLVANGASNTVNLSTLLNCFSLSYPSCCFDTFWVSQLSVLSLTASFLSFLLFSFFSSSLKGAFFTCKYLSTSSMCTSSELLPGRDILY